MTKVHLYGKLRRGMQHPEKAGGIVHVQPEPEETVAGLLKRLRLHEEDVYSIFLNHRLPAAKSGMACWVGYRKAGPDPLSGDLNVPVRPDDRLALFGRDMALLVI